MRNLTGLALLGLPFFLIGAPAGAHEVNLSFNDSALRATYATGFSNGLRLDTGWLGDSDEGEVVHVSLRAVGDLVPGGQKTLTPPAVLDPPALLRIKDQIWAAARSASPD